nr:amidohydrolase family protein [Phaeacidiphilus oryzae]
MPGPERESRHFPFAAPHRAGARLAMGIGWLGPVTDPNPLWAVHTAVTRLGPPEVPHAIGPDALARPLEPGQALDLDAALDAYPAGSAYADHAEAVAGTIAPGRPADRGSATPAPRPPRGAGSGRRRRKRPG